MQSNHDILVRNTRFSRIVSGNLIKSTHRSTPVEGARKLHGKLFPNEILIINAVRPGTIKDHSGSKSFEGLTLFALACFEARNIWRRYLSDLIVNFRRRKY